MIKYILSLISFHLDITHLITLVVWTIPVGLYAGYQKYKRYKESKNKPCKQCNPKDIQISELNNKIKELNKKSEPEFYIELEYKRDNKWASPPITWYYIKHLAVYNICSEDLTNVKCSIDNDYHLEAFDLKAGAKRTIPLATKLERDANYHPDNVYIECDQLTKMKAFPLENPNQKNLLTYKETY